MKINFLNVLSSIIFFISGLLVNADFSNQAEKIVLIIFLLASGLFVLWCGGEEEKGN